MSVNDFEQELYEAIADLVSEGELDEGSDAHGVARKVISEGYDSLTPKQRALYDAVVTPLLAARQKRLDAIHRDLRNPD